MKKPSTGKGARETLQQLYHAVALCLAEAVWPSACLPSPSAPQGNAGASPHIVLPDAMSVEALAALVIDACESEGVEHMVTGAFAVSFYGISRSAKDVDVVISLSGGSAIERIVARLDPIVLFDPQIQFDTLTWGKRQVGKWGTGRYPGEKKIAGSGGPRIRSFAFP